MQVQNIPLDAGKKQFDVVDKGDVVILLAFGAAVDEMLVWNTVEKHKKGKYTSIIHGKYAHGETVAIAYFARKYVIGQRALKMPVISGASTELGQYFVDFRIGNPPQKLLLVADIGSDLVWVKCFACHNCSRHAPETTFQALHSTTFSPIHCYDSICGLISHPLKHQPRNHTCLHSTCHYQYSYADGSRTSGFFSKETTTLNTSSGSAAKLKSHFFWSRFHVSGPSLTGASFNGARGVMGVGRGPINYLTDSWITPYPHSDE
ncbi:hypothetical protein NE237_023448 [Protea cynaroides]|uniref:Peptidase A1 domain-containing protein n=1 Tax=Protea cynaroides TaxID=273540 RepID=A0A9Q0HCX3_9MAGN|nr:hypothetical protein NE237_023448 [Protea cynaroides]